MLDIIRILTDNFIPFATEGKNTKKGYVNINCPFCDDKSNHLLISLFKNYAKCWRCGEHSIKDILNILNINVNYREYIIKKTFNDIDYHINNYENDKQNNKYIKIPGKTPLEKEHINYLINRKYDHEYLVWKYKLKCTTYEFPCNRIIIPIFFKHQVISYTSRDITNIDKNRYFSCKKYYEVIFHKNILYNIDNCRNDYIVVTEGCFKTFRLGDNSVATFGVNYTNHQLQLLTKFKRVFVFFDNDEAGQTNANKLLHDLHTLHIETYNIINDISPDELPEDEANHLMKEISLKIY